MSRTEEKAYGCVFCITGKEQLIADLMERKCPGLRALPVRQEKFRTVQGVKSKVQEIILPGYVFFAAEADFAIKDLPRENVLRILTSGNREWQLMGENLRFARWLFHYNGLLGFSQAYREGERFRIVRGPLKELEGQIVRIDKRGRSGLVSVEFNGRTLRMWLGFEVIDPIPQL